MSERRNNLFYLKLSTCKPAAIAATTTFNHYIDLIPVFFDSCRKINICSHLTGALICQDDVKIFHKGF